MYNLFLIMKRLEIGAGILSAVALVGCVGKDQPTFDPYSGALFNASREVILTSKESNPGGKPNIVDCFTDSRINITVPADTGKKGVEVIFTDSECHISDSGAYDSLDNLGIIGPNPIQIVDVVVDSVTVGNNPFLRKK
jgi:hypothetical protein